MTETTCPTCGKLMDANHGAADGCTSDECPKCISGLLIGSGATLLNFTDWRIGLGVSLLGIGWPRKPFFGDTEAARAASGETPAP